MQPTRWTCTQPIKDEREIEKAAGASASAAFCFRPITKALRTGQGSTAAAIPVTPGGLGTRDKITQLVLESLGVGANASGFAPLLYTLAMIAVSLTGVFFFLSDSWLRKCGAVQKET